MVGNHKTTAAKLFSLLAAVILCFTVFTVPAAAKDGDGSPTQKDGKTKVIYLDTMDPEEEEPVVVEPLYEYGRWTRVHSVMATFEKNYILSPEQKEYAITNYQKVVSDLLEPDMSDLEKYYTLAKWLNRYVDYDWDFWPNGYDFDYYSHQWDAYGILKERKSVCAGIAIAYANLCHAADLPCKFIRMKPFCLDHTINYIPDINGHAYYIDVTEDMFFMSDAANPWDPMDTDFAYIPKSRIPDDGSFDYLNEDNEYKPLPIKPYYDTPFDEWYKECALHQNTTKTFRADYVEKGSGTRGRHYASYKDFPKQFSDTETPGVWFLEDFYEEPERISSKILNKELDEQLLDISGIQGSYDCNSAEEIAAAVNGDIAIKYFPSAENNKVVAKAVDLTDADYTVSCDAFDPSTGEATVTITGTGAYGGDCQIPVRFNSAAVTTAPVNKRDLVYTGKPQALVEPATAINGTILYAVHEKGDAEDAWKKGQPDAAPCPEPADLTYTEELPAATDAGRYEVWYKVRGNEGYFDLPPQHLERVIVISPLRPKILADNITIKVGETIKLAPKVDMEKSVLYDYYCIADNIVSLNDDGTVTGLAEGTATIVICGVLAEDAANYGDPRDVEIIVTVEKGANPMKLKAKTVKVKRSKLKKKAQKIKRAKLIAVNNAQGGLTYKLVSAKKGKKSFKKYFKVNSKNGNVTVKKGLKKGKYLVKVKVKAAGNASYKPSSWKTVTSKVRVK